MAGAYIPRSRQEEDELSLDSLEGWGLFLFGSVKLHFLRVGLTPYTYLLDANGTYPKRVRQVSGLWDEGQACWLLSVGTSGLKVSSAV